jgi:hypothetical protein
MSKQTILIETQYYENYNVGPDGFGETPHWKPKGGFTFKIEMDADLVMYQDPAPVFRKMLESKNSIAEKFEYLGYDIQWSLPTVLGTEEQFVELISQA